MKNVLYSALLVCFTISFVTFGASPNNDDEKEVMAVIDKMFDGMRQGDSAMVSSAFYKDVRMASIGEQEGKPAIFQGDLQKFLTAVGTPHDKVWDEKIWDPIIQIDGAMATVWVNYAFYHGGAFSHCGVNAFQLFKTEEGWKIINITDTRHREGCENP